MLDRLSSPTHWTPKIAFLVISVLGLVGSVLSYNSLPAPRASVLPIETISAPLLPTVKVESTTTEFAPQPGFLIEAYPTCTKNEYLALPAGVCVKYPKCGSEKFLDKEKRKCRPSPTCRYREMLTPNKRYCIVDPKKKLHPVPEERVRWVNANIKSGIAGWDQDYASILATRPDFITLQEMNRRTDAQLAINGYSIYRSHDSPFTSETPVLWDSTRWEALATGTRYLTTRQVLWGIRAVNWVELRSLSTGRRISVLSAHPAPTLKRTEGLLPIFVSRLMPIVEDLYSRGEVFVGGDFNVHYGGASTGGLWGKSGLGRTSLFSTFDAFGKFATGEHRGATIDYMFSRSSEHAVPLRHGWWNGNSDHHALWSEWTLSSERKLVRAELRRATLEPDRGQLPSGLILAGAH